MPSCLVPCQKQSLTCGRIDVERARNERRQGGRLVAKIAEPYLGSTDRQFTDSSERHQRRRSATAAVDDVRTVAAYRSAYETRKVISSNTAGRDADGAFRRAIGVEDLESGRKAFANLLLQRFASRTKCQQERHLVWHKQIQDCGGSLDESSSKPSCHATQVSEKIVARGNAKSAAKSRAFRRNPIRSCQKSGLKRPVCVRKTDPCEESSDSIRWSGKDCRAGPQSALESLLCRW